MTLSVRVVLWVSVAIIASVATVVVLQIRVVEPEIEQARIQMVSGFGPMLQALPADQRADSAERLTRVFGYEVRVVDSASLSISLQKRVARGAPFADGPVGESIAHFPLPDGTVIVVGPLPFGGPPIVRLVVTTIITALIVAMLVAMLLVAPVVRGLRHLEGVSQAISAGDLSARATPTRTRGIDTVASAFNRMADQTQHLIKAQKHMLQAVSHEFRTPAARVRFDLELLEAAKSPEDKAARYQRIEDSLDELDELVGELLEYMRFVDHSPELPTEAIHIADELRRIERDTPRPDRVALAVQCAEHAEVVASRRHFRRIVGNLLQNALRHADSIINISVRQTDAGIELLVDDDGVGIPEGDRERVFEPFVRLDESRGRELGGAGLGLAVVEQIVKWHGGDVVVQTSPLGGARFVVRLPAHGQKATNATSHREHGARF